MDGNINEEELLLHNNQPTEIIKSDHSKIVERRTAEDIMEDNYLRYSMSVIVSRALPDVRDGLKPVKWVPPSGFKTLFANALIVSL